MGASVAHLLRYATVHAMPRRPVVPVTAHTISEFRAAIRTYTRPIGTLGPRSTTELRVDCCAFPQESSVERLAAACQSKQYHIDSAAACESCGIGATVVVDISHMSLVDDLAVTTVRIAGALVSLRRNARRVHHNPDQQATSALLPHIVSVERSGKTYTAARDVRVWLRALNGCHWFSVVKATSALPTYPQNTVKP